MQFGDQNLSPPDMDRLPGLAFLPNPINIIQYLSQPFQAEMKCHRLGSLQTTNTYFLQFWEA